MAHLDAAVHAGLALLVRAATVSPEPAELVDTPPPELVTPGTLGFLVTFFAAVAVVLLLRDMVRRNRRIQVRAERRDAALRGEPVRPPAQGGPDRARPDGPGPDARGPDTPRAEDDPDHR